jgi:hypothetical protein
MKAFGWAAVCAVGLLALAGCDDDDDDSGTGGTAACQQTTVLDRQQAIGAGLTTIPFTTTAAGRVDVTVDWTTQGSRVGAFVAQAGTCNEAQFTGGQCTFSGRSAGTGGDTGATSAFTGKPGRYAVQNAAAGNWELLLTSYGATDDDDDANNAETATVRVVQSAGTNCPAFP